MSSFLPTLYRVYDLVYDSVYGFEENLKYIAHISNNLSKQKIMSKPNYSEPKIYTGGVEISDWKLLSKQEQIQAMKKTWYIYYSFRDPKTGLMKRQTPIKGYANSLKTKTERIKYLTVLKEALEILLKNGTDPYQSNDFSYLDEFLNQDNTKPITVEKNIKKEIAPNEQTLTTKAQKIDEIASTEYALNIPSIEDAFEAVLKLKKNVMNKTSFGNYQLRIKRFKDSLPDTTRQITSITKKDVITFLNSILESTSPRNRNNYRTDLSSFFKELENNEYIADNFIAKINVLKSVPERNKTFSDTMQEDIFNHLEKNDSMLLLFIKFISYNLLRPVEACRLRIKDVDVNERRLYVRAKNQPVKIKIIPEILINDLPDLTGLNPELYLFTPNGYGQEWEAEENNRRDHFSKRFNEGVKKQFNLNEDYGLYSFRHTFITKLYRKLREKNSQQIAKSELMLITGHATITALDKYLRDIDAELPEDYSKLLS